VTEQKLPEELEEQAMLYVLGILDPDDRQAFEARLQGGAHHLRQTLVSFQTSTNALASAVAPVTPPPTLREQLMTRLEWESADEADQFERTADTLAFGSVPPVTPRDVLRDRLLSQINMEEPAVQLDVKDSGFVPAQNRASIGDVGRVSRSEGRLPEGTGSSSTWVQSCWQPVWNFLRTIFVRAMAPRPSAQGLTFMKASEGNWLTIAPGVVAKLLSYDSVSRRVTSLVRIAPGTSYAPHRHAAAEELYVLEGGCLCAGRELTVGDYHRAEAGTEHHDTSSDDGCLLLVISSPENEMLSSRRP
jgi:hypothetical protein